MNDYWNYETKCRRCGDFTTWPSIPKSRFKWVEFAESVQDRINNPRQFGCHKCGKMTVQDVVSYDSATSAESHKV